MSPRNTSEHLNPFLQPNPARRWARRAVILVIALAVLGAALTSVWYTFYHYVPPGKMLAVISKNGKSLPPGHLLADADEKGVQKAVLGEGWHWITPLVYDVELKDDTVIQPGQVGLVTQLGGDKAPGNSVL